MFGFLCATVFMGWLVWFVVDAVMGLRRNVKAARESGLKWFVARKLDEFSFSSFVLGERSLGCGLWVVVLWNVGGVSHV